MKYQGRVVVVTGAGSGIGRALTQALTAGGAHVAASDIDDNGLAETQASCGPGQVTPYRIDVADRDAVLGFADEVRRKHGPASMVFNNAGVDLFASVADMSWEDFDWLMGINVGGVVNGTKAFLPQLIEAGSDRRPSRLVNLSSAFGLIAVPYQGAYSTSKFAVRGFTEALRQEMIIERHPVTVHCVHPGVVRTNFGANMRTSDTEDPDLAAQLFDRAALTTPARAARLILRGAEKNRARILIGADGRAMAALPRLLGVAYAGLLARAARLTDSRAAHSGR
ncbi:MULTISPECIES: SDR family NAD(P)-dependent oxidoreductase [Mycobacterium avium complex (MAC)]|jgi:NAD(P)-dependent dehydrogenase (short-subunit alcohol dehydrogenase family)|uniref:Acetoin dehydrogenase n=4 Tax=Mycobacterium avium complex (MAC) TaxID=120793 RepID=A0AAW5S5A4_MYCBC|nr:MULTISPECIES: SDR family NAD(P)-dependent oxidoreductase [Mycobacterium avium complex (MAC)]ETA93440.1 acetoin dehydrogenase [Mycobacterium avium 05-4293]ETB11279.1 acetoin dehydrogenase [Mycobacterium avium subsp. silvaticum ATCC 49884]ETB18216.1 acetoin dehydrogenase [Mycobacterium avium subsp. avium 10-9275]ETB22331.1 acetoin dehydrogenase [Mycobacterium avium subsp. avium 11-4751]ETB26589.1 acetoin dehydrogenase [Mycobacterium avium 09-5983]ETB54299.1 acetoin dehydrogenase [Mycobacteri